MQDDQSSLAPTQDVSDEASQERNLHIAPKKSISKIKLGLLVLGGIAIALLLKQDQSTSTSKPK